MRPWSVFGALQLRPRQRPVTNVVAVFVIAVTFLPILAAYTLTREGQHAGGEGK